MHLEIILAYPTVALIGEIHLGSWGTEFDWPDEYLTKDNLGLSATTVMTLLKNEAAVGTLAPDRSGKYYVFRASPTLLVGGIPASLAKSSSPLRKRLRNYGRKEKVIAHALEEAYTGRIMRDAIVHNLPNMNAAILATCEAAENEKFLAPHQAATIKKSCFQIRALVQSTSVLLPSWKPSFASENPLNVVHKVIHMQRILWAQDLRERNVEIELGTNYSQVHMQPDLLVSVFSNMMSNVVKYAMRRSVLKIYFDEFEGLTVSFEMDSVLIDLDEVESILRPGVRGKRSANTAGHGIGLALVDKIMTGYSGRLEILPGVENKSTPGFSRNVFRLHFAKRWVKYSQ